MHDKRKWLEEACKNVQKHMDNSDPRESNNLTKKIMGDWKTTSEKINSEGKIS